MKKYQYIFYTMFHPVGGFEEMKYRKGASVPASIFVFIAFVLLDVLTQQFTGSQIYIYEPEKIDLFGAFISRLALVLTWSVSNWSFCVLMEGKANFSQIWVISNYALLPYITANCLNVFLSNFITREEAVFTSWLLIFGTLWSVMLIISAFMAYHEFSLTKSVCCIILTLIGMLIILFLFFLFLSLIQQVASTLITVFNEIIFRFR